MVYKKVLFFGLSALVFNNWLLGFIFNWHLLSLGGSVSELSALTQPHHWLFRSLDILSGALFLVCGGLLAKYAIGPSKRLIAAITAVMGLGQIIDAALVMPCSGTLDKSCVVPVRLSLSHPYIPAHAYSSTLLGICFLALPLIGFFIVSGWRLFKPLSFVTVVVTLAFFGALFKSSGSGYFQDNDYVGYSQALQMLMFGIWFSGLAVFSFGGVGAKQPGKNIKAAQN